MLEHVSRQCPSASVAGSSECALADVVDEIAARLRRGERLDLDACFAQHPQWQEALRRLLPALEALAVSELGSGLRVQKKEPEDGEKKGSGFRVQGSVTASAETPNAQSTPAAEVLAPALSGREREIRRLGDFELVREIGRGGMGVVYEARQTSLGRRVAVKVLPRAGMLDSRHLQRFQNEARAAAQLNHPHIVDVICVGCADGVHYFAMRYVEGETLAEKGSGAGGQGSGHSQIAEWIAQAAEALEHAHQSGVVHRDVKQSNFLVDRDGKLWVTDFGLARFGDEAALTMTGDLLGTLRYMSPEQALGQRAAVDHRSDVYALGATLYELLAGQPVFEGTDRGELLRQAAFAQPRPLRKLDRRIPRDLETIALKALEKSPTDRYATAGEMAADLRRYMRGEPIRAAHAGAAHGEVVLAALRVGRYSRGGAAFGRGRTFGEHTIDCSFAR